MPSDIRATRASRPWSRSRDPARLRSVAAPRELVSPKPNATPAALQHSWCRRLTAVRRQWQCSARYPGNNGAGHPIRSLKGAA